MLHPIPYKISRMSDISSGAAEWKGSRLNIETRAFPHLINNVLHRQSV
jgi:hypothetical protein